MLDNNIDQCDQNHKVGWHKDKLKPALTKVITLANQPMSLLSQSNVLLF
jgi:hypothetical protein